MFHLLALSHLSPVTQTVVMRQSTLQSCFSVVSVVPCAKKKEKKLCFTQYFIRNDYRFLFVNFHVDMGLSKTLCLVLSFFLGQPMYLFRTLSCGVCESWFCSNCFPFGRLHIRYMEICVFEHRISRAHTVYYFSLCFSIYLLIWFIGWLLCVACAFLVNFGWSANERSRYAQSENTNSTSITSVHRERKRENTTEQFSMQSRNNRRWSNRSY